MGTRFAANSHARSLQQIRGYTVLFQYCFIPDSTRVRNMLDEGRYTASDVNKFMLAVNRILLIKLRLFMQENW